MISDCNRRHLGRIIEQIKVYRSGDIALGSLIGAFELLFNAIDEMPDSFRSSIDEAILSLEEVHAVSLDSTSGDSYILGVREKAIVDEALSRILSETKFLLKNNH